MGPKLEQRDWWDPWLIAWYPFISLFRLARIFLALTTNPLLAFTPAVQFLRGISFEVTSWSFWLASPIIVYVWNLLLFFGRPMLWWISIILPQNFGCNGPGTYEFF